MAVVCDLHVVGGTHAESTRLQAQVERRLNESGGPPDGLMFACVHPHARGFRILLVFRSAEAAQNEIEGALRADAAAVGIDLGAPATAPVWHMALPAAR